jgi:acyl-coenzyme A synthetase/AMP-(fatty) acid ligase
MNCLSDILDIYKDSDKLAIIFVDIEQNEERISFKELNLKLNLVRKYIRFKNELKILSLN